MTETQRPRHDGARIEPAPSAELRARILCAPRQEDAAMLSAQDLPRCTCGPASPGCEYHHTHPAG